MLRHLGHEVIVVEEEEADHSDDEEGSTSGLVRGETDGIHLGMACCSLQSPARQGFVGNNKPFLNGFVQL